ncbi:MAG: tRNA (adenosine(37)-N6)-threonylcarbamoyltransferase complex dimerization subunit type 1 TsaB [Bacillota bacterium]
MNVLGIDTSGPFCTAGLAGSDGVLAERSVRGRKIHSVRLLPLIEDLLADTGLLTENLDGVAVSAGPGSFTGLRIGLTTARTLAQVLGIPVVGVSSLEVLVYPLCGAGRVWALVPARRGEVYAALYDCGGGAPDGVFPPAALEIGRLLAMIKDAAEPLVFVGEGAELYGGLIRKELGEKARFCSPAGHYPRGGVVAWLGREALREGRGREACALIPEYISLLERPNWFGDRKQGGEENWR